MHKILGLTIAAASLTIVLLALVGGVLHYSPIPFWDMWDGSLSFYMDLQGGNREALVRPHNEHRIILSRLLFLLDFELFGGKSAFLITVNYLLVFTMAGLFWNILYNLHADKISRPASMVFSVFITALLFFWTQHENFTWGFQSQFLLSPLLMLASLMALSRDQGTNSNRTVFIIACLMGVLNCGTMANGLLTLPALFVAGWLLRLPVLKLAIIATLAVAMFALYFSGPVMSASEGSPSQLIGNLPKILVYWFCYLGSPLYEPLGGGLIAGAMAGAAGMALVGLYALTAIHGLAGKDHDRTKIVLFVFIGFILHTGILTAIGRVDLGLPSAVSSRYTTPALLAWASLLCLYSPLILRQFENKSPHRIAALSMTAALTLGMLSYQTAALKVDRERAFAQRIAMLALELGINDRLFISSVYPAPERALAIARRASDRNLSSFGIAPFRDLGIRMGQTSVATSQTGLCQGRIEDATALEEAPGFLRIRGWILEDSARPNTELITFQNDRSLISGFALTGAPRAEFTAPAASRPADSADFLGYIRAEERLPTVTAFLGSGKCTLAWPPRDKTTPS